MLYWRGFWIGFFSALHTVSWRTHQLKRRTSGSPLNILYQPLYALQDFQASSAYFMWLETWGCLSYGSNAHDPEYNWAVLVTGICALYKNSSSNLFVSWRNLPFRLQNNWQKLYKVVGVISKGFSRGHLTHRYSAGGSASTTLLNHPSSGRQVVTTLTGDDYNFDFFCEQAGKRSFIFALHTISDWGWGALSCMRGSVRMVSGVMFSGSSFPLIRGL